MSESTHIINIAIAGGKAYCREILEKIALEYPEKDVNARVIAVADPDPQSPGMLYAKERGLITVSDYHEFYDPKYHIDLILIMHPGKEVFNDILKTRPSTIRIMAYDVFEIFWKAIRLEEKKLRAQNEEIKTILDGIQDFILVITPDMEIVEMNNAFLEKMRYSRKEVIGKKCFHILRGFTEPCNHNEFICPLNEVIRNRRACHQTVSRTGKDGKPKYIDVSVFPIWEKDGKISKFIEISRDVTAQKIEEEEMTRRLERIVDERTQELKETHQKLHHQDKMASLGKLAASVVHEINNPIAGILNLIMLKKRIINEGPLTNKELEVFKNYLNLMEMETRRISRIVSNLLSFSRHSKMEFKQLDINRLLEITLFMNSNLLKINGVKVIKKIDPKLPKIFGSEDQLQQVFMNIVSNAAEAMETSPIRILTIETDIVSKKDWLLISFKDTGVGIPKDNMPRLFEPFFTTKRKGKGVGLGLSVVYGIIKDHGGSILVESEKETTFTIHLPLTKLSEHLNSEHLNNVMNPD